MPFKVQVGPSEIAIHQGHSVLVTEPDGQIEWPSEKGLYFFDTRVISAWAIRANGEKWELLNGGAVSYFGARIFLTNQGDSPRKMAPFRLVYSDLPSAGPLAVACMKIWKLPITARRK